MPSPNGITLTTQEKHVYVGVTRSQQIWRLPLMLDGTISKTGVAVQLSGGVGGPDGIEMDGENGLLVCQLGVGIWRFDSNMLPTHLIHSPDHKHHHLANIAFGGPDLKTLYITESMSGDILMAKVPFAGKKLYGHAVSPCARRGRGSGARPRLPSRRAGGGARTRRSPDLQALYDRATTAAEASRHDEAAALFYQGLEALRAEGRGESPDAGMFASGLADALAAARIRRPTRPIGWRSRFWRGPPIPCPSSRLAIVSPSVERGGAHDEAVSIADAMLRRTDAGRTDDAEGIYAIETALGVYGAAGRDADADRVLATA